MAVHIYPPEAASLDVLQGKVVAVLGYGNQGRFHALNLRDSGVNIVVGQRSGKGFDRAIADGFAPMSLPAAASAGDLLILSLPDEAAPGLFERAIAPELRSGQALGFLHGFGIHFGLIRPPVGVDVILVAPKGPGTLLRSLFLSGKGLPSLVAVEQDATGTALSLALAWAAGIGSHRAALIQTSFSEETITDLFGEQVVLCGGVSALTKAAFETLVEAGFEPEFAYLECVHELKQVVDLLYSQGLSGMRERISGTARFGDLTRGPVVIDGAVKENMRRVLRQIVDGAFARDWMHEYGGGGSQGKALFDTDAQSLYEDAGRAVRRMMPWLSESETDSAQSSQSV